MGELRVQRKQEARTAGERTKGGRQFVPAVEIYETPEAVVVRADLPGVPRENVKVSLEDGVLTIDAAMPDQPADGRRMLVQEFERGHYLRRFTISEAIDQGRISARMTNGVLTLELPKQAPAKPRCIEVQCG